MKKGSKILLTALGLLSGIGIIFSVVSLCWKNKAISVIGGSDGPTSIFIATKATNNVGIYTVTAVLIVVTIVSAIIIKKKK